MVDVEALKPAMRAAIVTPSVFAFATYVIGRPQVSLFAAFGSFAVLVLVEFGGTRRVRLAAYAAFAAVGAGLIVLGTLCSRDAWIAATAMTVVGFVLLFSGSLSGYAAAAANGAVLLFVLPANVPAPNSAIPDRLLGWFFAAGVGTVAVLFLWPPRGRANLRRSAAEAVRSVVELIEAEPSQFGPLREAARGAADRLARSFLAHSIALPARPRRRLHWLRFPTSSTGFSRSCARTPITRRRRLSRPRNSNFWLRPRISCGRAPTGSTEGARARTSSGPTPRSTR